MDQDIIKSSSILNTMNNGMSLYTKTNPLWPTTTVDDTDITKCITCTNHNIYLIIISKLKYFVLFFSFKQNDNNN